MQLSLTQPCSWALLLLLLSNLLLWENVVSVPMCEVINGQCQLTLEYLLNRARGLSENTNRLTSEIFNEFDKEHAPVRVSWGKIPLVCYNYSLPVSDSTTQEQEIQPEVLLKVTIGMLLGWNHTLRHIAADMADLKSIPGVGVFISNVRKIAAKFTRLTRVLQEVKSLLKLVRLEPEEDDDYPASTGFPSLHLLTKPSRLTVYHAVLGCVNYDAEKIATHVKILRCKMIHKKC
ncbi:prolactin-5A1-like [Arvicanthis niloticus]|uniref:prolactin-5A1-like n=1 Tax=Arvicanthis niloticus TaxID=61156 RepID=UPI001486215E|nr:prolactin-5A1-like [Arvicanthis niloticus]